MSSSGIDRAVSVRLTREPNDPLRPLLVSSLGQTGQRCWHRSPATLPTHNNAGSSWERCEADLPHIRWAGYSPQSSPSITSESECDGTKTDFTTKVPITSAVEEPWYKLVPCMTSQLRVPWPRQRVVTLGAAGKPTHQTLRVLGAALATRSLLLVLHRHS